MCYSFQHCGKKIFLVVVFTLAPAIRLLTNFVISQKVFLPNELQCNLFFFFPHCLFTSGFDLKTLLFSSILHVIDTFLLLHSMHSSFFSFFFQSTNDKNKYRLFIEFVYFVRNVFFFSGTILVFSSMINDYSMEKRP